MSWSIRDILISDTLLLTHGWTGDYHDLGIRYRLSLDQTPRQPLSPEGDWREAAAAHYGDSLAREDEMRLCTPAMHASRKILPASVVTTEPSH